ncbi:F-box domain-containing protein [Aphis craccivora]|uniref:F-box domain-containing protein n=1 Tax=Aphis craccivora TaxID=307492 RepID=A0A6G0ZCI1_APHCR|nr:F-box domain-containing protein [Aphis craccivora]
MCYCIYTIESSQIIVRRVCPSMHTCVLINVHVHGNGQVETRFYSTANRYINKRWDVYNLLYLLLSSLKYFKSIFEKCNKRLLANENSTVRPPQPAFRNFVAAVVLSNVASTNCTNSIFTMDNEKTFDKLPVEVIITLLNKHTTLNGLNPPTYENCATMPLIYTMISHIFEFLKLEDRKVASTVCWSWYNASIQPRFLKKT